MLFNSLAFLLFLPIVAVLYLVIPYKYRWLWLLVASYYFYMNWNATYALLILTSTVITYLSGRYIYKSEKLLFKKTWVAFSFISNLGILFFYKYFNFFSTYVHRALDVTGISMTIPEFDLLLPVGISFYTFQALSYTVDIYRNKMQPEYHFGRYALFVSFFPQLVAGPIERSTHLLPQFRQIHKFNYQNVREGLILMLWGYFKKIVIADRLAILVNTVYNNPNDYFGIEVVVATLFFAIQIYCDFSGYTDIARGVARVMGFDLMKNFNRPYFSKSITEFWQRWHISLSTWFRDYLYIPLGGNRNGETRTYFNLLVVFLVSGLWHGAAITFVVWGALHGLYIMIEKAFKPYRSTVHRYLNWNNSLFSVKLYQAMMTSFLVTFAWIFFRANTFSDSLIIIKNMTLWNWNTILNGDLYRLGLDAKDFWVSIMSIWVLLIFELLEANYQIKATFFKQTFVFRWVAYISILFVILIFGVYGSQEKSFIYFQF